MNELIYFSQKRWPEKITVHWQRFSSGLWRVPKGDISAAYCAESFPKIKVFIHEGGVFANCGGHFSGPVAAEADCYPLILPGDYCGPEPRRFTYEGRPALHQGNAVILGPKVMFAATDATVDEWRLLFRAMYADGGWFARQSNYGLFLHEDHPMCQSENACTALNLELADALLDCSKEEMKRFLDREIIAEPSEKPQLHLAL
jgi:hypothetical protein